MSPSTHKPQPNNSHHDEPSNSPIRSLAARIARPLHKAGRAVARVGHTAGRALVRNARALTKLFSVAYWKIFWFELVFHLVIAALVLTQTSHVLNLVMRLEHYAFISWELLPAFLSKPPAIALIVLLLLAVALLGVFEISCIAQLLTAANFGLSVPIRRVLAEALKTCGRALRPSGWLLVAVALILFPFLNASVVVVLACYFFSPQLVLEQAYAHRTGAALMLLVLAVLAILAFLSMYTFPYVLSLGCSPREGLRRSVRAGAQALRHAAVLIGVKALFDASAVAVLWLIAAAGEWVHALPINPGLQYVNTAVVSGLTALVFILIWVLSCPVSLTVLFHGSWELWEERLGCASTHAGLRAHESQWCPAAHRHPVSLACSVALAAALVLVMGWGMELFEQEVRANAQVPASISITAHRGASGEYPENTMAAFRGAALERADWIELDVQQSKDGVLFVSHDSNFLRISGVNKNSWELNYAEISQLDAGKSFAPWWKGQQYPTLESVIKWAKMSNQHLNIELKPTGHEVAFERSVANLVREQNYGDFVLLTSQSYPCVQRLKQVAPEIRRAYVTNFVYGDISQMDAMDVWSVKYTSCTRAFVRYAHTTGRPVLAWTVNSESTMLYAINNGVDGIITNHIGLARKAIADSAQMAPLRTLYDLAMSILFG